jgi:hypothetical protein
MPVKSKSKNISRRIYKKSKKIKKSNNSKNNKLRSLKSKGKLKLIKIVKSPKPKKKYRAYFSDGTHTDFGAKGMQNYGGVGKERHLDKERKKRYISRHKSRENWNSPKTAGSLSRWVLWNKDTLRKSIADYKKRFKL